MNLKKTSILIIIILPFILFWTYFYQGFPVELIGSDLLRVWGYNGTPIFDFYHSLKDSFSLSFWSTSFSRPHFNLTSELTELFQTLLYFLTQNIPWTFKLDTAIHMIVAGLGSYTLSYTLFKDRWAAFLSAILYMLCPFLLDYLASTLGKPWAMALMPWGYLFLHKTMFLAFDLKHIFISALLISLTLLGHPENFFLGGIFYTLFVVLLFIFYPNESIKKIPILGLLLLLVFLLTSFTYLPSLIHPNPYLHVEADQIEMWLKLNIQPSAHTHHQSQSFLTAFLLLDWEWMVSPLVNQKIPLSTLAWAMGFILTILALMQKNTNKMVLVFAWISIFGLWFTSGLIFSSFSIYGWLHHLIPHFRMTRHPDRYLFHVALAFSLMAPLTFNIFSHRSKYLKKILCISMACLFIGSSYFYAKTTGFTFHPFQKPEYIDKITDWLTLHNQDNYRVINAFGCPTLATIQFKTHAMADQFLINYYDKDYFADLLNLFGFKYIIIGKNSQDTTTGFSTFHFRPDLASTPHPEEIWTKSFSNLIDRKMIFDSLNENSHFTAHPITGTDVVIFENKKIVKDYELYPSKPLLILGSYQAYDFLSHPHIVQQGRTSPIFISQPKNQESLKKIVDISDTLLLHNTTLKDLALILNRADSPWIEFYPLKSKDWQIGFESPPVPQLNPQLPTLDHSWLLNSLGGNLTFSKFSITPKKSNVDIAIPFSIHSLNQRIFIRLKQTKPTTLKALLNNKTYSLSSLGDEGGFHWVELPLEFSSPGSHHLTLFISDPKSIYLDAMVIIDPGKWEILLHKTLNQFTNLKWIQILQNSQFLFKNSHQKTSFLIPRSGHYKIVLSLLKPMSSEIRATLNNKTCLFSSQTKTLMSCSVYLEGSQQKLILPPIDFQWISIEEEKTGTQKLKDILLTHTETYFPGWHLKTDQKRVDPIIAHLFMNGFIIPKDTVSYQAFYRNKIHIVFASISLITFLSMIGFLLYKKIK